MGEPQIMAPKAPTIKKLDIELKMDEFNTMRIHVELEEKAYSFFMQILREILIERIKGEGRSKDLK